MVKKVVYPAKRNISKTPYDYSGNKISNNGSENKDQSNGNSSGSSKSSLPGSIFTKVKNFIANPWSSYKKDNADGRAFSRTAQDQEIITHGDEKSTIEPFKYPAPDSSLISNITSRKASGASGNNSFSHFGSNSNNNNNNNSFESTIINYSVINGIKSNTPKAKLINYLHEKGISEVEAEGILSLAKHIDNQEDQSNQNDQNNILDNVIPSQNKDSAFHVGKCSQVEEADNDKSVIVRKESKPNTSIFSVNDSKINHAPNSSIYSLRNNTAIGNTSIKRIYSYSEMPSPFKINLTKKQKPSNLANKNTSILGDISVNNSTFLNNTGFVTARENDTILNNNDNDVTMTSVINHGQNTLLENGNSEKANLSATASALLSILDKNKGETNGQEPTKLNDIKQRRKGATQKASDNKYEILINPYSNSSFSKIKNPKSSNQSVLENYNVNGAQHKVSTPTKALATTAGNNKLLNKLENTISFDKSPSFEVAPSSTPFSKPGGLNVSSKKPNGSASSTETSKNVSQKPVKNFFSPDNAQSPSSFPTAATSANNKYKPSISSSLRAEVEKEPIFGKNDDTKKNENSEDKPKSIFSGLSSTNANGSIFGTQPGFKSGNGTVSKLLEQKASSSPGFSFDSNLQEQSKTNEPTQSQPFSFGNKIADKSVDVIEVPDQDEESDNEQKKKATTVVGLSTPAPKANITTKITAISGDKDSSIMEIKDDGGESPLVNGAFDRMFAFPALLKQEYLITDIDEQQVEQFKKLFNFV